MAYFLKGLPQITGWSLAYLTEPDCTDPRRWQIVAFFKVWAFNRLITFYFFNFLPFLFSSEGSFLCVFIISNISLTQPPDSKWCAGTLPSPSSKGIGLIFQTNVRAQGPLWLSSMWPVTKTPPHPALLVLVLVPPQAVLQLELGAQVAPVVWSKGLLCVTGGETWCAVLIPRGTSQQTLRDGSQERWGWFCPVMTRETEKWLFRRGGYLLRLVETTDLRGKLSPENCRPTSRGEKGKDTQHCY